MHKTKIMRFLKPEDMEKTTELEKTMIKTEQEPATIPDDIYYQIDSSPVSREWCPGDTFIAKIINSLELSELTETEIINRLMDG